MFGPKKGDVWKIKQKAIGRDAQGARNVRLCQGGGQSRFLKKLKIIGPIK